LEVYGSSSLPLVSKGKLHSTLVLNLQQCTFFSSTCDHPALFVTRFALAPMYTALGLTSLDQVI
jgi:hypothetical protein